MIGYEYFSVGGFAFRIHMRTIVPLSFPHREHALTKDEIQKLLKKHSSLFLRWDSGFDSQESGDWWHVIKDTEEVIAALPKKTRYQIRKGLEKYSVKRVQKEEVIEKGYEIYKEVFKGYNTIERPVDEREFVTGLERLPEETEFWAVFEIETNKIVGFSENIVRENACFYLSIWMLPSAMKAFAGYSLFHVMNSYYLNTLKLKYVSDGARSISHDTNIHDFLQSKFGFRKAYSNLNIVYRPWFGFLVKVLFPFKPIFEKLPGGIFTKVSIVLFQEQIHRSCCSKESS